MVTLIIHLILVILTVVIAIKKKEKDIWVLIALLLVPIIGPIISMILYAYHFIFMEDKKE